MKMSLKLLVVYLFSIHAFADFYSIIPNKTDQSLFYLYKNFTIDQVNQTVKVTGLKVINVNSAGEATINVTGNVQTISYEKFMFFRQFSPSIFSAITGDGNARGTAFLITNNLVLTNKHIADTDNIKKSCGNFSIMLNGQDPEEITCKKVWYCDSHDFCVIELNKTKTQKSVGEITKPLVFTNKNIVQSNSQINSIGNVRGLGIQGGTGHGIKYVNLSEEYGDNVPTSLKSSAHQLIHFAPTLKGSSGSPLLNNNGLILGINYAESGSEYGDNGKNYAVPSYYILSQLKANLPHSLFSEIKTAAPSALTEGDKTFEKAWSDSWNKFSDLSIYKDEELKKCLDENHLSSCYNEFYKIIETAKNSMPGLGEDEKDLILLKAQTQLKVIVEINKILSLSASFELRPYQERCEAYKDLSFECVKEDFITDYLFRDFTLNKWLMSLSDDKKEELIKSIINRSQLSDRYYKSKVLSKLESNKNLMGKIFVKCLDSVKTISSMDNGWLGESRDIGYEDQCSAIIVPTIKSLGYILTDYTDEEIISSMRYGMTHFKLSETFRISVAKKWDYLLLRPLMNKDERKVSNINLIEDWIKIQGLEDISANELFMSIQKKMRLFY